MKIFLKLKKFICSKRPLISFFCCSNELFFFLEKNLKTIKELKKFELTYRYSEADVIIISGFFTPKKLLFFEEIIKSLPSTCKVFIYSESNLIIDTPNTRSASTLEKLFSLIRNN